jgi:metal-responsive CopG/Arc/MetJ family transcriptional regulator
MENAMKTKKEKRKNEIRVLVQPSLYEKIQEKCDAEYRTMSEVVRELLAKYIKEE